MVLRALPFSPAHHRGGGLKKRKIVFCVTGFRANQRGTQAIRASNFFGRCEMEKILADIEAARKARQLNNEAANLATSALSLEGDEAMVGNRIVSRGSDPASLELIAFGKISDATRRARAKGPGCLTAEEREPWLVLAAASLDESGQAEIPPSAKIAQFIEAVNWLRTATAIEKAEGKRVCPLALYNNVPNPFNPSTVISYSVPGIADAVNSWIKLEVVNIQGQLVKTLVNGMKIAGSQSVCWNGTDNLGKRVGSGAYFYRLRCGGKELQKQMVYLR